MTAEADWQRVAAEIERQHGRLDGLVNAAGIAAVGSIEKTDFATWRRVLGGQSRRHLSRLQIRVSAAAQAGRLDRQSVVGAGPDRQPQPDRLQCLEGRRIAAHQIGRAQRRALQAAGALQRRVPGLCGRPDGGRDRAGHARRRRRCSRNWRSIFRSAGWASRRRSPISAFICCRTRRRSSPAPMCRSMAG